MRSTSRLGRACAIALATAAVATTPSRAAAPTLIPALQIDGRGFGHGVGMAQDGALAMGQAGASLAQILGQFYPGTSLGRTGGPVRVPVYAGNNVEIVFPDGGEVRGNAGTLKFAPGAAAVVSREGDATRVKAMATPPPTTTTVRPSTTTSAVPSETTTSTTEPLIPIDTRERRSDPTPIETPTSTSSSTTTTTAPPPSPGLVFSGAVTAAPSGDGRVGIVPRGRRYRGVIEMSALSGGVRFVNQVPVETYLRGMGEVRNPSWPAASLQAQAVAARTYAMRAMATGGELCDTQRCQVYLGADAEYAAMDRAVAATAGQVLMFGKGLASAVYSANGGGFSASREEGFGLTGPSSYPYLRAAPYLCTNPGNWTVTLALADVATRLGYAGKLDSVTVAERGGSGRATRLLLRGSAGDAAVTGLAFDAALGLRSTLFNLTVTLAGRVEAVTDGSLLQAPPEDAAAIAGSRTDPPAASTPKATSTVAAAATRDNVGPIGAIGIAIWAGVIVLAVRARRRTQPGLHALLS